MSNIVEKIDIRNDALIHANSLKNNSLQKRQLKEIITDIIKRISQELISAHREGKHLIITNIPITYSISNMTNKDSQRVIWSNIIDELKSKSYRVWISPNSNTCNVKITWMSDDDESDIENQLQLIVKHTQLNLS
jgi:hypothetical protein